MIDELLKDVKRFLYDIKRELPEVFGRRRTGADVEDAPVFIPKTPGALLKKCRKEEARDIICERVRYWSRLTGAKHGRISVKDQKTLWGSCSRKKNLNFNWRLAMAPPEILDYVIVHELSHLLEMNHSKRFWALVARWCPVYRDQKKWLRKHSSDLKKTYHK